MVQGVSMGLARMERMERIFATRHMRARIYGVRGQGSLFYVCVGFIVSIPSILSILRLTI